MLIHCIENPPADGLIHYCGCSIKVWYISVLKNFDGNFYPWRSISWTAKKNTLCYFILRILLNTKFFKVSAGSVSHTPALQATSVGLTRETYWNPKPETQITCCINLSPVAFSKQWNSQIFWHPGSVEPRPTQHTKKSWETLHVALGFLQVSSWIFCNGSTFHSSHLYLQKQVRNHWNHPESIELVHIIPTVYEIHVYKLKCKSETNWTIHILIPFNLTPAYSFRNIATTLTFKIFPFLCAPEPKTTRLKINTCFSNHETQQKLSKKIFKDAMSLQHLQKSWNIYRVYTKSNWSWDFDLEKVVAFPTSSSLSNFYDHQNLLKWHVRNCAWSLIDSSWFVSNFWRNQ